ncbi:flagellar hook-basal body complex protein [Oscillospiraceae bacterium OttesenSCG-928-G22]|nr:flagellar hook-basal body complex protein [Oscillospiraceae bacterium OttesenSCG-928-G22]
MIRSLNSAVSGMKNHQTRLDVIANNVANVNTFGFKSSRVTFKDMFSQTTQGASAGSAVLGGTNPRQIGLGMSVQSIDLQFSGTGSAYTTDNLWDMMIEGDGLFIVSEGDTSNREFHYTRAGNFTVSPAEGNSPDTPDTNLFDLVTADGLFVMGVMTGDPSEEKVEAPETAEDLDRIQIPGNAMGVSVDQQGNVSAIIDNEVVYIARIGVAQFANYPGLEKIGDNLYDPTTNSGAPVYSAPAENGAGKLKSGALEMSNVNLAQEFSDLITTQRGYQANARIITVSDTILEELINLKR